MRLNGKRGSFLLPFGLIHFAFGAAYIFPETTESTAKSIGFLLRLGVPVVIAGLPWVLSAIAAIAAAFDRGRDWYGFAALVAVHVAWTFVFLLSWVLGDNPRGYAWALMFAGLAWATYTVSGMVDPDSVKHPDVQK
ncbi:hypothetical protein [Cellulomonas rhizosphaerae]|uniref:DoxX family protein n=1 Tax=Cellulomonas rhizosphaerae TaxID=2293719 RepID=A0A413RP50_9CELL|nr:hypothetical protein [Cellulomonas rhizosphaerae]RHA43681.1 hypothetical protein D1825_05200 [Cellulomonas rhizosphaerae]